MFPDAPLFFLLQKIPLYQPNPRVQVAQSSLQCRFLTGVVHWNFIGGFFRWRIKTMVLL